MTSVGGQRTVCALPARCAGAAVAADPVDADRPVKARLQFGALVDVWTENICVRRGRNARGKNGNFPLI